MSLSSVLDRVRSVRKKKTVDTQSRYFELVRELSDSKEVDADELAGILDALDKSDDALQADVERFSERVSLAHRLTQAKAMEAEQAALDSKLAALIAAQAEAYRTADLKIAPLRERYRTLTAYSGHVGTIEERLVATCQDPAILEETAAIDAEREVLMPKIRAIQGLGTRSPKARYDRAAQHIEEKKRDLPDEKYAATRKSENEEIAELETKLEAMKPEVDQFVAEYAALQKRSAELDRQQAALRQRKLIP